jgi:hypothetical protein
LPQHRFQPGHHIGRPKGSRNKLGVFYFDTLLKVASEQVADQPQLPMSKLEEAMRAAYRKEPLQFLKMITNTLQIFCNLLVTQRGRSRGNLDLLQQWLKKSLAAPKPVVLLEVKRDEKSPVN